MSTIIKEPWVEYETEYSLAFDDGHGNGFGFPCDEHGNLLEGLIDAAYENYQWCLEHPEKFERFKFIEKREWETRHRATIRCNCGEEFELSNQYLGACECPECGQWYNLFGQELKDPPEWED